MFIRPFAIIFSAIALAGVVTAVPSALDVRGSQCDTGSIQCCNHSADASSDIVSMLLGLSGFDLGGNTDRVGFGCSSIVGTDTCSQEPVCCTGNSFSGLLVIGCSPININL